MGILFSTARQPQLTIEGDKHALLRLGWDFTYEHEHGFSRPFWNHLTGKTVEFPEGFLQPRGVQPVAPENVFFSDYTHILHNEPHRAGGLPVVGPVQFPLRGIWLGAPAAVLDVPQVSRRLWEFRRDFSRSGVDVSYASWCEDVVAIWFRSASEMAIRFEEALSGGTAVFGLTLRVPDNLGRMEPYLATSAEFAYSVLGKSVYAP